MQNRQITRVVMNEGLTSIGEMAFFNSGIQEIVFPSTLRQLAPDLFYYCDRLKRVDLSLPKLLWFKRFRMLRVKSITAVCTHSHRNTSIHDDGTSEIRSNPQKRHLIGMEAFRGSSITTVQLPNNISTIETCLSPAPT